MAILKKSKVDREFLFTEENFQSIVGLIDDFSGIKLSDHKQDMVYSRLARRLRALGLSDFNDYLQLVKDDSEERESFINSLTTNLTHFFRENHHFTYLQEKLFPELFANKQKKIRFWSAGCSTGEEPYSLSMVWQGLPEKPKNIDFKILATDLDTDVLESCKKGIYSNEKLKPLEEEYLKWFKKTQSCRADQKQINPKLKDVITFKKLNLMSDWPMHGPFDLIICRNVLIYFDKETQKKLVERFYDLLTDNGCLMLGHSENLSTSKELLNPLGQTIYRKEK